MRTCLMDIKQEPALAEVLDFLTSSPSLDEIIAFKPSEATVERMRYLLDANRNNTLTAEEQTELEEFDQINHFMIMLKAHARKKLVNQ